MVGLTPADSIQQDHFIIVEWVAWFSGGDAVDMIDLVVDMMTANLPGVPLIHTSEVTDLSFSSSSLAARWFSIEAEGVEMSGAIGFGACPASLRLVGIRYVYNTATRYGTALDDLAAVLATLSC